MTTETERLARVEALLEEMRDNLRRLDTRIDRLETRIDHLEARIDRVETRIDRLEARQEANFRWLMGAILGMWVTVISVVLGALLTR